MASWSDCRQCHISFPDDDYENCPLCEARTTMSKPLMFKEIPIGGHFIAFPLDGDDSGHGGFRGAARVCKKLSEDVGPLKDNDVAIDTGVTSHSPAKMKVLRVLI